MAKQKITIQLETDNVKTVRKLLKEAGYPRGMMSTYLDWKIEDLIIKLEAGNQDELKFR